MRHPHRPRYYYMRVRGDDVAGDARQDTAPRIRYELSDLDSVVARHERFAERFPRVKPSYAVGGRKCNADPAFVEAVASSGCSFNCRSIEGVRLVSDRASACGGGDAPPFAIFSSPCKSKRHIAEARFHGVRRMTVESVAEVVRISAVSRDIALLLRISPTEEEEGAAARKHGADGAARDRWADILRSAKARGMEVAGVSFRLKDDDDDDGANFGVPTGGATGRLETALKRAREALDLARSDEFGFEAKVLDLGAALLSPDDAWRRCHSCSATIVEEEDEAEDSGSVEVPSVEDEQDDDLALLEKYFSREVEILAEPAEYVLPDDAAVVKWWGTPKVRRTAPSLYAYLMHGGPAGGKGRASLRTCGGYRPCCGRRVRANAVAAPNGAWEHHHPPQEVAAAQA